MRKEREEIQQERGSEFACRDGELLLSPTYIYIGTCQGDVIHAFILQRSTISESGPGCSKLRHCVYSTSNFDGIFVVCSTSRRYHEKGNILTATHRKAGIHKIKPRTRRKIKRNHTKFSYLNGFMYKKCTLETFSRLSTAQIDSTLFLMYISITTALRTRTFMYVSMSP